MNYVNYMKSLPNINECTIAVVGLGYVGLPVAVEFAKTTNSVLNKKKLNRKIIGFDINESRINKLKEGIDTTKEIESSTLNKIKNISFTTNKFDLAQADVYIVTVPTPIDDEKKPELSLLKNACKIIGESIKNSTSQSIPVVIFESTVYPGATEEICIPIIEEKSKLEIFSDNNKNNNKSFAYGYSPERINPGDKEHKLTMIVKVTSGNNKKVSEWVNELYGSIIKAGTFNAESIKVAEAAKVIENTQRDLNIALINELSIIFNHLNINTLDVIEAAKTKWNFLPFKPGLVGGHCIGVDPYYLTYKSKNVGYNPEVILAGRKINDEIGEFYIKRIMKMIQAKGLEKSEIKILILGFTFKENCPDIRNTGTIQMIKALKKINISHDIIDPWADQQEALSQYDAKIDNNLPVDSKYSAIIVTVAHEYFKNIAISKWESMCANDPIIFDLKGIVPNHLNPIRP